jgi:hypothetical protein
MDIAGTVSRGPSTATVIIVIIVIAVIAVIVIIVIGAVEH